MGWDPEIDDPVAARRRLMTEHALAELGEAPDGGNGNAADDAPDAGLSAPDAAPADRLAPIDPDAPVSGHRVAAAPAASIAESPEHDWSTARGLLYPAFRPVGMQGLAVEGLDADALAGEGLKSHSQPLVDEGPCGLPVVYVLASGGFDVLVNADHLLTWGVGAADIQDAGLANLAAWSAAAAWSAEESGGRKLLSSASGDGWDAVRILLPDACSHLQNELGVGGARVLVGLPERDLLVAGALAPEDAEFAALFGEFVVEQSGGADEPIDRRVFELVDGRLVEFGA